MAAQAGIPALNRAAPSVVLSGLQWTEWARIALIPPFVLLCYAFDWTTWRSLNTTVFLSLAHALHIPALRVSSDTFTTMGHVYYFAVACTVVDAFFGSIPLLWEFRKSIAANCTFFAGYSVLLFCANMMRLAFGMLIFVGGVPWWLSHEVISGFFYFLMFLWIARRRHWSFRPVSSRFPI